MWIVDFIPAPLRAYAMMVAVAGLMFAGWYGHVVYSGYVAQQASEEAIKNLAEGQAEIINFNQDFDKGFIHANQDDCVSKPIPDSLRLLLNTK